MSKLITAFQWGYAGWGNATKSLVSSFDKVEEARGYEPAMFIDIRFSRSVRSVGFRDRAFEDLLGHSRYRWMRSLGNAGINSDSAEIQIQCPDAVEQLLDFALDAAKAKRRIIYFCSCHSPQRACSCHRAEVSKLLIRAARRRGENLITQEWPGSAINQRVVASLKVTDTELLKLQGDAKNVELTRKQVTAELLGMPHGSLVRLVTSSQEQLISAKPPVIRGGLWLLPLFIEDVAAEDTRKSLQPRIVKERKRLNLEARGTENI